MPTRRTARTAVCTQCNGIPAAIKGGSTWNRQPLRARGKAIGEEARALGVHVVLEPSGGPLGKIAHGGRKWEGNVP